MTQAQPHHAAWSQLDAPLETAQNPHRGGADGQLVTRVLAGELAAFEALMRRHNQRMYRAARAVLRDDNDAQDAAQQAWLAVYAHLAQWDGRAAFASWAVRIAVHEAVRRARTRHREPLLNMADDSSEPSHEPGPEDHLQQAQLRALLEHAIDRLPESMRVVLMLRDLSEMSSAEAADALSISEEAVRVRLHRARRMLRELLEQTLEASMGEAFPFLGPRCDAIVHSVLAELQVRLGLAKGGENP